MHKYVSVVRVSIELWPRSTGWLSLKLAVIVGTAITLTSGLCLSTDVSCPPAVNVLCPHTLDNVDPMLFLCWPSACDTGPSFKSTTGVNALPVIVLFYSRPHPPAFYGHQTSATTHWSDIYVPPPSHPFDFKIII